MFDPIKDIFQKRLERTYQSALWLFVAGIIITAFILPLSASDRALLLLLALLTISYIVVVFRWLLWRLIGLNLLDYISISGIIIILGVASAILEPYLIHIEMLYLVVIVTVGILIGQRMALFTTILAGVIEVISTVIYQPPQQNVLYGVIVQIIIFFLSSYIIIALINHIREIYIQSDRQNRYLGVLLEVGMVASRMDNLQLSLSLIVEVIVRDVPVTSCQICLLSPDAKELIVQGAAPVRPLPGWKASPGVTYPIEDCKIFQEVFNSRQHLILGEKDIGQLKEKCYPDEKFFENVRTIGLFPLITRGKLVGMILTGESRRWEREPFTREKIHLLQTLATQIAAEIDKSLLLKSAQRQAERLQVLNEVAKAIGSTIELDHLLEMIYEQVSRVISTDTYFVALAQNGNQVLEFRILIDNGVRYPVARVPIDQGLASWVYNSRQTLFIHNMEEEWDHLPIKPVQLGTEIISQSWLGCPLIARNGVIGVLAIASYRPNAFSAEDSSLLNNLATQAALALDNAWQHAAVKEQAQRDSLTGVYNHGYFLNRLEVEVEKSIQNNQPVSLIMLDVDYFKNYNDLYGHVIGDEVLKLFGQAIQSSAKDTDVVGRWGGEEFAIALPGKNSLQALDIARNIRESMKKINLFSKHGEHIPYPTVSQGIATLPDHACDTAELVDVADSALYEAKSAGRNQIVIARKSPRDQ